MNHRYLGAGIVLWILAASPLFAQNSADTSQLPKGQAELLIPRPQFNPRQSMEGVGAIDTLDTSSPGVKIILYADNTWGYYRDPSIILTKELFKKNWSDASPNPYGVSLSQLPDKITIWTVDSLSAFKCPNQTKVYSPFGVRHRRRHQGVDLPLKTGDPVYAAFSGKVRISRYMRGYGNLVVLRHENGLETFYGHLSRREVEVDDWVEAGQVIGLGGSTGRSTGPHLHFETRFDGFAFDPQWMIDFEKGELRSRLFVLKRKYLSEHSRYVPESDEEEDEIAEGDRLDYERAAEQAKADSIRAAKAAAERAAARYYTIRKGDTLSTIARKNGTTISKICRLNQGLTPRTTLKIGRKIRVK